MNDNQVPSRQRGTRVVRIALGAALLVACSKDEPASPPPPAAPKPAALAEEKPAGKTEQGAEKAAEKADSGETLPNGLLLAYAQFLVEGGKVLPKPGPARLEVLRLKDGEWEVETFEDSQSNVFHKAMTYTPADGEPGILTFAGMDAAVKLWRKKDGKLAAETLWTEKFGGKWDRMRDGEVADVYGDGKQTIIVATHDQGVVAALRPTDGGGFDVVKLGARPDTFVHEIELGDLNSDGVIEVYATPSEPNRLDGTEQHGEVWRFVPKDEKGPEVVADLGNRHAKEILVDDVDGDGKDELYVAVEALTKGKGEDIELVEPVEIRRYDADTPPDAGEVVATLPDRLCRFLTAGDVDGDGKKEMVAAAYRSGVWMLRSPAEPGGEWTKEQIDAESSGFEHAAVLADLDGDGKDELYVAADEQGEIRRYVWENGKHRRETIHTQKVLGQLMTWNLMPVPVSLLD
jgi:hypothetical protein